MAIGAEFLVANWESRGFGFLYYMRSSKFEQVDGVARC
jgi:hypothetical protein